MSSVHIDALLFYLKTTINDLYDAVDDQDYETAVLELNTIAETAIELRTILNNMPWDLSAHEE